MVFQNNHSKSKKSHFAKPVSETCPQCEWKVLKHSWRGELMKERDFCVGTNDGCRKKTWVGEKEKNWKAGCATGRMNRRVRNCCVRKKRKKGKKIKRIGWFFFLKKGRCRIHLGRCKILVPSFCQFECPSITKETKIIYRSNCS